MANSSKDVEGETIRAWPFTTSGQETTARHYPATNPGVSPRAALLLAPGAGAGQGHAFMVGISRSLAALGFDVVTFDFPYSHAGRRRPDAPAVLEQAWRDAIALVRERLAAERLVVGGKSMGGRIATQVAAAIPGESIAGVVSLGYPLRPPGRPAPRAVEHFASIRVPFLILQGTRDAFGGPDDVRAAAEASGANVEIVAIEGGDHSFVLPRRAGVGQSSGVTLLATEIHSWIRRAGIVGA